MPEVPPVVPIAIIAKDAPLPEEARTQLAMPPTTTHQENLVTAGQRRVNLIWEGTQGLIAISITLATIYAGVKGLDSGVLFNAFFLVVGFYFSRTNHTAIGGVGPKATDALPYPGR